MLERSIAPRPAHATSTGALTGCTETAAQMVLRNSHKSLLNASNRSSKIGLRPARLSCHGQSTTQGQTAALVEEPSLLVGNIMPWRCNPRVARVDAPLDALPLVLLPGFGNCSRDYECPSGNPDDSMAAALRRRGFKVYVVRMERGDWLRVGRSLLSKDYWARKLTVDPGYRWYLERIQQAVDQARLECRTDQVHLVGHSAGGWLGRAFVADPLYFDSPAGDPGAPNQGVASLVTLGTPHLPKPDRDGWEMTGGALTWVNLQWPGAHFAGRGVRYVCVSGAAVRADRGAPLRSIERYAHRSYSQVCGDGHGHLGDCVVPTAHAHLEGATDVILEGVFHSMTTNKAWAIEHRWYGSEDVVDHWAHYLVTAG